MKGMIVDSKFNLHEIVYLKTDECILPRIVTGIMLRAGQIIYYLSCGEMETNHFEIEITRDYKECMQLLENIKP